MSQVAIVEQSVDIEQLARSIARGFVEYQDGERALRDAERKTEGLRERQSQRRLDLGRQLIEAKRGIRHGGWLPYLEKLGIPQQTANAWMREAGFIEEQSKSPASANAGDLGTRSARVEAGIDKRPRKRDEEPANLREDVQPAASDDEGDDPPVLHASWRRDLSKALVGIDKMIMGYAKSWPRRSRFDLAKTLRSVAERIERMTED